MRLALFLSVVAALGCGVVNSSSKTTDIGVPSAVQAREAPEPVKGQQTAVFAGGCFWGVEAVFESLKGVVDVKSGYAGGMAKDANYDAVSEGDTQHAEAVVVTYDPAKISYSQLLDVFFSVAHDPTELNRQGPDTGSQYRSAIFFNSEEQQKQATAFVADLDAKKLWPKPIVTQIVPLVKFFDAEAYHQNYLVRNPRQPYIVQHDMPKLAELKKKFPEMYVGK
ncbi:MAG: peptide-methionine (S)-S-oxide reductase MsrA [Pyrinomonadaceae bacterium]